MLRWCDSTTGRPDGRGARRDHERGSALLIALMISIVMFFLGMGLLLQTSLGLQASSTDRWVVKALYAADSGAMLQVMRLQQQMVQPITAVVTDNPDSPGLTSGTFTATVTRLCETEPPSPIIVNGAPAAWPEFQQRHFNIVSNANRTIGGLAGLAQATVELDVSVFPFTADNFVPVAYCTN